MASASNETFDRAVKRKANDDTWLSRRDRKMEMAGADEQIDDDCSDECRESMRTKGP